MNRIVVVGDTHGVKDAGKIKRLQESDKKLDYNDYIIICGDAGIVWSKETLKESIDYFESLGTNILFVDGNHENFDMLKEYKKEKWNGGDVHKISEHIIHLMRGQVFSICGKTFFTMGGADSTDKEDRIEHQTWWREEKIGLYDRITAAYLNDLEDRNNTVDYVITHTLPTSIVYRLEKVLTKCGEEVPYFLKDKIKITESNNALENVLKDIKFKHCYCGHFHIDQTICQYTILYETIVEL